MIATVLANDEQLSPVQPDRPIEQVAAPIASPPVNAPVNKTPEPASLPVERSVIEPLQADISATRKAHASPSVRLFARELGVDVAKIKAGSGRKGRILKDDVKNFVKKVMAEGIVATGAGIPSIPAVDFSPFGETETKKLSKD